MEKKQRGIPKVYKNILKNQKNEGFSRKVQTQADNINSNLSDNGVQKNNYLIPTYILSQCSSDNKSSRPSKLIPF